jgi:hypothetical protein
MNDPKSEPVKETVILVHGTWTVWDPKLNQWFQPAKSRNDPVGFAQILDKKLQELGSPARCWTHCADGEPIFYWTGANSWIERTKAADALRRYVTQLREKGWRCHVIAHSHGGNIALEALAAISNQRKTSDGKISLPGKIVTLGTPFMLLRDQIRKTSLRRQVFFISLSWIGLAIYAFWMTFNLIRTTYDWLSVLAGVLEIIAIAASLFALFVYTRLYLSARNETTIYRPPNGLLALGSKMDEAWQILHHISEAKNPMAPGIRLPKYIARSIGAYVNQKVTTARIHGIKFHSDYPIVLWIFHPILVLAILYIFGEVFTPGLMSWIDRNLLFRSTSGIEFFGEKYLDLASATTIAILGITLMAGMSSPPFADAFLSPFRYSIYFLEAIGNLFKDIGFYYVRRRGWSFVQLMAMGLEGYPHALPSVKQKPDWLPESFFKYEDMPEQAERSARSKRRRWIELLLDNIEQTFANLVLTDAEIAKLLLRVEEDQSLVHAGYYAEEACIARIAEWISGPVDLGPIFFRNILADAEARKRTSTLWGKLRAKFFRKTVIA